MMTLLRKIKSVESPSDVWGCVCIFLREVKFNFSLKYHRVLRKTPSFLIKHIIFFEYLRFNFVQNENKPIFTLQEGALG